jgi:dTDP-glucose 4,6-dehydratase
VDKAVTTVLITGGCGFVASHYVEHVLATTDWNVVVLDKLEEVARLHHLAEPSLRYGQRLRFCWHDLRAPIPSDLDALQTKFKYVVHFAAASHVDRSVAAPLGFIMDNVLGTAHLLEWARMLRTKPEKVLYFSTDEVMGPAEVGDMSGFDPYSSHFACNPYAASKSAAEMLCPAWASTYDLPIVVSHATNIYGPRQHHEKFIPSTVRKVNSGEIVQIHARGGVPSTRYYVYCDDVSRAVQTILERGGVIGSRTTGRYNIGGLAELSNLDVAVEIAALLGKPIQHELVDFVASRPRHDQAYSVDSSALQALGWRAEVDIHEGLRRTVLA